MEAHRSAICGNGPTVRVDLADSERELRRPITPSWHRASVRIAAPHFTFDLHKDGFISKISGSIAARPPTGTGRRAAESGGSHENASATEFFAKLGAIGGLFALAAPAQAQTSPQRRFIKTDFSQSHAYSQAVVTQGGRTVWLAGQTSPPTDASGKSLAGDFDGQVRALFAGLSQTLEEAGGKLSDIVTMTVFMVDDRFDLRFLELRKEIFKDNFPASALINIHSLVPPYAMIEIQCVAVIA